ncbi:uncharacterized protein [Dysidea avara]|uniref:uncharacterized protein n=1 Tax=Dysidea avara TaxID=196820 RepID=UPI003316E828
MKSCALLISQFLLIVLCQAEDKYVCTPDDLPAYCGCIVNTTTPFTVNLQFDKTIHTGDPFDKHAEYIYGGCFGVPECDAETAICLVYTAGRLTAKIGLLETVTYLVKQIDPLNVTAIYKGGNASAVIYLMCNETFKRAKLTYLHDDSKFYYFELIYSKFCVPANNTTMAPSTSTVTTMTTTSAVTKLLSAKFVGAELTATRAPVQSKHDENRNVVLDITWWSLIIATVATSIVVIVVYLQWKKRQSDESPIVEGRLIS